MREFVLAWTGVIALALLVWVSRHVLLSWARRYITTLHAGLFQEDVAPLPSVSFLVAGKDEEENIAACVKSILAQDYPQLQVIAANDRSTDATGPILDGLAAQDSRLSVIHVHELRPGWLGKNNAMREAVERSTGQWLCFTDADCTQVSARSLRVAMNYALSEDVDFLSVLPAHDAQSFWECVVQPACSGVMMIWFNPILVNNPSSRAAYANGAFMLMRRDCYQAIGGHDAVKEQFNEDMHMAQRAKAVGRRLRVVPNEGLYTVRMYGTLAATWAGWSRIFYGCFGTMRRLVLAALVIVFMSLLPWATLAISSAVVGFSSGPLQAWQRLALLSGATCFVQLTVTMRFYAMNRTPAPYGLLYPVGTVISLGALVNAMRRLRRRATITWRGTTYQTRIASVAAAKNPGS